MPFGAQLLESGGTRFRVWAPSVVRAELQLLVVPEAAARAALALLCDAPRGARLARGHRAGGGRRLALQVSSAPRRRRRLVGAGSRLAQQPAGSARGEQRGRPARVRLARDGWRGRAWADAVVYELHVGTFTPEGTFAAATARLPDLAALGITAFELMPLAAFPGTRNWGYDGVLPFAPAACYGTPEELKAFVDARAWPRADGAARRRLQPFRSGRQLSARLLPAVLQPGGAHALGRGDQLRRPREPHGARLLRAQRALLDRGILLRRPAARRRARHSRLEPAGYRLRGTAPQPCATGRAPRAARASRSGKQPTTRRTTSRAMRLAGRCYATAQWDDDVHHALHVAVERRGRRLLRRLCSPIRSPASDARWPRASPIRASTPRFAANAAASRARTCRRTPSWDSSRTTT